MKKIVLIYPPFCTPAGPPYSITNLYGFLKNNLKDAEVKAFDLNAEFHSLRFKPLQGYFHNLKRNFNKEEYENKANEFIQLSKEVYRTNNKNVVAGKTPECFKELLNKILDEKPDLVAFSIVYSSQVFYAYALIKELKKLRIKTVAGGPAVNTKIINSVTKFIHNEIELLEFIKGEITPQEQIHFDTKLDYSIYNTENYFVPEMVVPIKTTSTCYYQRCAFCSHHSKRMYYEFPLDNIIESVKKHKFVFIVDDMIHKKRALEIAKKIKPLNISWMCQLKPTNEFDLKTLKELRASGLKVIFWGVESACQRVLNLMQKGTVIADVQKVLENSTKAGIKNGLYIMFGFPTETKEEFLETIQFLDTNRANIDIVSASVFGLQASTPVYNNPDMFGISKIDEEKRTLLEPRISYTVKQGMTQEEAKSMKKKYRKTLENLDRYPRQMNFFREHLLYVV